jgi:hypothetical protein
MMLEYHPATVEIGGMKDWVVVIVVRDAVGVVLDPRAVLDVGKVLDVVDALDVGIVLEVGEVLGE